MLPRDFVEEAIRIASEAEKKNIILRIMGAVAIRIKCTDYISLYNELKRGLTDIDFAGYSKQGHKISALLKELGYELRKDMLIHEGRYFFYYPSSGLKVDIFLDKLSMSHTINFRNRLELDFPTITLADLVLEKLQIVKINEKDLKDLVVLFRSYDVGDNEKAINGRYIAKLLADDWGFYYTATTNLERLKSFLKRTNIPEKDKEDVSKKIEKLSEMIETEPKTLKWRLRSKIGPRMKWYTEVEEAER